MRFHNNEQPQLSVLQLQQYDYSMTRSECDYYYYYYDYKPSFIIMWALGTSASTDYYLICARIVQWHNFIY